MLENMLFIVLLLSYLKQAPYIIIVYEYDSHVTVFVMDECVPLKIHMLKPFLKVWCGLWQVIRIAWGHESKAFMKGISVLIRVMERPCIPSLLCHARIQGKVGGLKPRREPLLELNYVVTVDLWLPNFRNVRNIFLFFKTPNLCYFVIAAWTRTSLSPVAEREHPG